ncbi:MAG: IS701 family transposase, partial [Trebonia sp.]
MTERDIDAINSELESLYRRIDGLFSRADSRRHAHQYIRGLLSDLPRKNGWTIAEYVGEREPKATQRFLNLSPWDADEALKINRRYVMEHFTSPEAILVADPTGFAKKGTKSAGVQRQYSGTPGRTDNCQIGTFLAYVTPDHDRALIDRRLYLPQVWIDDRSRCDEAGIPAETEFKTRPQQVIDMIEDTRAAAVPFAWFTADEEFGQNPGMREYLQAAGIAYVMAVPKNTRYTDTAGDTGQIQDAPARLNHTAWQRRACG